jgi:hypothetical protein
VPYYLTGDYYRGDYYQTRPMAGQLSLLTGVVGGILKFGKRLRAARGAPPGFGGPPAGFRAPPGVIPRFLAGTSPQAAAPSGARGHRYCGVTKSGKPRKCPRMNPANPRALRRAVRRQHAFIGLAKRVLRGTGITISRHRQTFGKRRVGAKR